MIRGSRVEWDVIVYIETVLQSKIVKEVINEYKDKKVLIICQGDYKLLKESVNCEIVRSRYSLHGYKQYAKSVKNGILVNKKYYKCTTFIAPLLTGINSIYYESIVEYEELCLIDDGVGSIYAIKYDRPYENNRLKKIVSIHNALCWLMGEKNIKYDNCTIKKIINKYYSLYHDVVSGYNVKRVMPFYDLSPVCSTEAILFVGQPVVEKNMMTEKKLFELLVSIAEKEGRNVDYYMHPNEKANKGYKYHENIKYLRSSGCVEDVVVINGYRKIMSFQSTVLINLTLLSDRVRRDIYRVDIQKKKSAIDLRYDRIFEGYGIERYLL